MDNRKYREQLGSSGQPEAAPVVGLEQARAILSRSLLLLDEVVVLTHRVLAATPPEVAVAVFVHNEPVAIEMPAEPRKRPRGGVHPLLALVKVGVNASRLVKQMVWAMFPQLIGKEANQPATDIAKVANEFEQTVAELLEKAREMGLDPGTA